MKELLVWQSVFMKFLKYCILLYQLFVILSFKTTDQLTKTICFWYSCSDFKGTIAVTETNNTMEAPILSFLEPEGQGRGIVMEAPHLLLVQNILFRKSTQGMAPPWHTLFCPLKYKVLSSQDFKNHLQTRSNLHEKGTSFVQLVVDDPV